MLLTASTTDFLHALASNYYDNLNKEHATSSIRHRSNGKRLTLVLFLQAMQLRFDWSLPASAWKALTNKQAATVLVKMADVSKRPLM